MPASKAGRRLSRIRVVFPEPDTPVTTVSLPFRNIDLQRFDSMDAIRGHMNVSLREQFFCLAPVPHMGICRSCQKRSNHGYRIGFYFLHRTFCDHVAATRSGFRTHLNDPVRFRKDLRIVIYQQYGISIRDQIVHHTREDRRY